MQLLKRSTLSISSVTEEKGDCPTRLFAEKGHWRNGNWEWDWNWRRRLFIWETGLLDSLQALLSSMQIIAGKDDSWNWRPEPRGSYSIKSAYYILQGHDSHAEDEFYKAFWCKKIPLKISAFAWKAVQDRIPSRFNLVKNKIIPPTSNTLCLFFNSENETTNHLLLTCPISHSVWMKCYNWWHLASANSSSLKSHFSQHMGMMVDKVLTKPWKLLWFLIVYQIWKHRNALVFQSKPLDPDEIFDQVKLHSWSWLKHRYRGASFNFAEWCLDPNSCITFCSSFR